MFGKEKIKRILEKKGIFVSVSTVGRVLKILMEKNKITNIKLLIRKYRKINRIKKKERYAKLITERHNIKVPGELLEVDHMVLNLSNGLRVREFRAVDLATKISISRIYNCASSINAKKFLEEVINELDFKIKSVQIDGGTEFMSEFEYFCKEQGIKLCLLHPGSPKLNGCVERTNRTYRYEFWNLYNIPNNIADARILLKKYEKKYNYERMHQSLNYLTPMDYYQLLKNKLSCPTCIEPVHY